MLGEIDIEINAIEYADAAQRLEAGVDLFRGGAELRVGRVAKAQHGEPQSIEARGILGHQPPVEISGALWRVTLTPGRNVDNHAAHLGECGRCHIGHVDDLGVEAGLGGDLLGLEGEALGVARFGPIEQRQRRPNPRGRSNRRRDMGKSTTGLGRLVTGQEPRQPSALLR